MDLRRPRFTSAGARSVAKFQNIKNNKKYKFENFQKIFIRKIKKCNFDFWNFQNVVFLLLKIWFSKNMFEKNIFSKKFFFSRKKLSKNFVIEKIFSKKYFWKYFLLYRSKKFQRIQKSYLENRAATFGTRTLGFGANPKKCSFFVLYAIIRPPASWIACTAP